DETVQVGEVEHPVLVVVALDVCGAPLLPVSAQLGGADDVGRGRSAVDVGDVGEVVAAAEHPEDRGDPAAGGEEQDLGGRGGGEGEVPGRLVEHDEGAGARAADEVGADPAVWDRLDGDLDGGG